MWNCIRPIGRQCASGLSLLFFSTRSFFSAVAQGVNGRPPFSVEPISKNWLRNPRTPVRLPAALVPFAAPLAGLVWVAAGVLAAAAEELAPCGGRRLASTNSQSPVKSGLPSAVRGVGPFKFGLPSASLGTFLEG